MAQQTIVSGPVPKYRQLLQILRNQILSGQLAPGQQLPTEEELSLTYRLSRGTVRKAVAQLELERLVLIEQGLGSFVRDIRPTAIPFQLSDEHSSPKGQEDVTAYRILAQEVIPASIDVSERLRISSNSPVIHVARLRMVNGRSVSYSSRYLPESICPSLLEADLTTGSIHDFLVIRSKLPLYRAEIEIEAHILDVEMASILQAKPGGKAIVMERLTYTSPNRPAIWFQGFYKDILLMQAFVDKA